MKIRAAVLLCLLAGVASAQSTIRPGGGGGSSTITAGTTATSGCTDGGFLYSLTSLVRCGANALNDGTKVTFTATTEQVRIRYDASNYIAFTVASTGKTTLTTQAASTPYFQMTGNGNYFAAVNSNGSTGGLVLTTDSAGAAVSTLDFNFNGGTGNNVGNIVRIRPVVQSGGGGDMLFETAPSAAGAYVPWLTLARAGSFTVGSSSLGTSVVPLTLTPGTGSTANIQNWTNSAGTVLSNVYSSGIFNTPAFTATSGTPTGGYAQGGSMLIWANTNGTVAAGYTLGVGSNNTWVGENAGNSAGASVDFSVAVGRYAMPSATGTTRSTAVGASACYDVTTGDNNTCLGIAAGYGITTGSGNTIVGQAQPLAAALSNNVILADGGTDVVPGQQRYRAFAPVTLTEAGGAETVLTLTSATTNTFTVDVDYMVTAKDATPDYATRKGSVGLVCVNKATVVTCTSSATSEANDGRNGGGSLLINTNAKTLTYAIAVDVATANVAKLTFNIDSDMTVTSASITMTVTINGTVTPS